MAVVDLSCPGASVEAALGTGALRAAAAGAFLAGAFLAGALLAGAFGAGAFFAEAFLAGAFLAEAFLAGAFFAGAFETPAFSAGASAVESDAPAGLSSIAFAAGAFAAGAFAAGAFAAGAFVAGDFVAGALRPAVALFLAGAFLATPEVAFRGARTVGFTTGAGPFASGPSSGMSLAASISEWSSAFAVRQPMQSCHTYWMTSADHPDQESPLASDSGPQAAPEKAKSPEPNPEPTLAEILLESAIEAEFETGRREETEEEARHSILMRLLRASAGFALIGAGIALMVLPGSGWVVIIIGLSLLPFKWAERTVKIIRSKIPGVPEEGRIPTSTWVVMIGSMTIFMVLSILFGDDVTGWVKSWGDPDSLVG
ncbi:MAG TPA: PGPGW domain-containing protein [Microthrixaceae bacterium]|nr:PGPGW domain-containing protein [Microthrixaceae bacterium]